MIAGDIFIFHSIRCFSVQRPHEWRGFGDSQHLVDVKERLWSCFDTGNSSYLHYYSNCIYEKHHLPFTKVIFLTQVSGGTSYRLPVTRLLYLVKEEHDSVSDYVSRSRDSG